MPATQQSDNTDDIQNEDEVMDMMEENNEELVFHKFVLCGAMK